LANEEQGLEDWLNHTKVRPVRQDELIDLLETQVIQRKPPVLVEARLEVLCWALIILVLVDIGQGEIKQIGQELQFGI